MNAEAIVAPDSGAGGTSPGPISQLAGGAARRWLTRLSSQLLLMAGLTLASYFFISHFVLQSVQVVGVSMAPTLQNSGCYFLNRLAYCFRDPRLNEVVVIRDPIDNGYDVKRIIAGPGDFVHLEGGRVYVNGRELKEPYLPPGTPTFPDPQLKAQSVKCAQGEYFVLGDNRKNSADSRAFGPIQRRSILGVVIR